MVRTKATYCHPSLASFSGDDDDDDDNDDDDNNNDDDNDEMHVLYSVRSESRDRGGSGHFCPTLVPTTHCRQTKKDLPK